MADAEREILIFLQSEKRNREIEASPPIEVSQIHGTSLHALIKVFKSGESGPKTPRVLRTVTPRKMAGYPRIFSCGSKFVSADMSVNVTLIQMMTVYLGPTNIK